MLLCEVAVGKSKNLYNPDNIINLESNFNFKLFQKNINQLKVVEEEDLIISSQLFYQMAVKYLLDHVLIIHNQPKKTRMEILLIIIVYNIMNT